MKMQKVNKEVHSSFIGIGGMFCSCCTQGKPSETKKWISQTIRRNNKQLMNKIRLNPDEDNYLIA